MAEEHEAAGHLPIVTGVDDLHPHARHTGHRWVDMIIALSAISISIISLFVTIQHGRIDEKLVAANSWPFIVYDSDSSGIGADNVISLRLKNSGVGPARVQSVRVWLDGKAVRSRADLLRLCCGVAPAPIDQQLDEGLYGENAMVGVLSAGNEIRFLAWRARPGNTALMSRLNSARDRLKFSACYCSVLDDCWRTDLRSTTTPTPVKSCAINGDSYSE